METQATRVSSDQPTINGAFHISGMSRHQQVSILAATTEFKRMLNDELAKSLLLRILSEHRGHDFRISRADLKAELSEKIGEVVADRKMRTLVEELRFDDPRGSWICGSLEGGYFFAIDEDELEEHLRSDEHRALTLLARIRNQRTAAGQQNPAQLRMELNVQTPPER